MAYDPENPPLGPDFAANAKRGIEHLPKPIADAFHSKRVTLETHCQTCKQPVSVTYEQTADERPPQWVCPYVACLAVQDLPYDGRIVRVAPRDNTSAKS